ncbi:MAG TPA: GNAT family N-acetyltransferase [Kofleriaceae bacterium]|jgi:phosphinothricin acetyltransferase
MHRAQSTAIRPARAGDFAAIAEITNFYIATTAIHFAYEPIATAELEGAWRTAGERFPWLVAEEAGAVVGYAKAGTWRDRDAYSWTCEVGLYIADAARGRGLGGALYRELLAEVARRGFRSAIAGIALPNDASVALHARLGFAPVGVVREAGFKHDRWHDVAFYQLALAGYCGQT